MYIYIFTFSLSCFLFYISTKSKSKLWNKLTIIIAILLPCLLAGLRGDEIGTDVTVYAKPLFTVAKTSHSFSDFLLHPLYSYKMVNDFEIGYLFLTYFIAKLFNNFHVLLFTIELLMLLPLYKGLKKFKNMDNKIWLCMLIYYLIFFNLTLNAMRQFIGISISFYALSLLINRESSTKKCVLYIFISMLFHKSSALAFLILIVYLASKNRLKIVFGSVKFDFKKILFAVMTLLITFIIIKPTFLSKFLDYVGFDKYTNYVNGNYSFSYFSFFKLLPLIVLYIFNRQSFNNKYDNSKFYSIILILSIIIGQAVSLNIRASRISYIFSIFFVVIIPLLLETMKNNKKRNIYILFTISYLLFYWYYIFVYMGSSETVPYSFYF